MAEGFRFNERSMRELETSAEVEDLIEEVAEIVADKAVSNARAAGLNGGALTSTPASEDADGVYADVGYDRHHPDFVDWFHEVGTSKFPPSPHLRPAASRRVI